MPRAPEVNQQTSYFAEDETSNASFLSRHPLPPIEGHTNGSSAFTDSDATKCWLGVLASTVDKFPTEQDIRGRHTLSTLPLTRCITTITGVISSSYPASIINGHAISEKRSHSLFELISDSTPQHRGVSMPVFISCQRRTSAPSLVECIVPRSALSRFRHDICPTNYLLAYRARSPHNSSVNLPVVKDFKSPRQELTEAPIWPKPTKYTN